MKESPEYLDQSASGLQLSVVDGDFNKDQLSILMSETMHFGPLKIDAAVIGASHCISMTGPDFLIHEVFACLDVEASKLAYCGKLGSVLGSIKLNINGYRYKFYLPRIYTFDEEITFLQWKELQNLADLMKRDEGIGLRFQFPNDEGFMNPPETIVIARKIDGRLTFQTLHSYPNEQRIVLTKSIMEAT